MKIFYTFLCFIMISFTFTQFTFADGWRKATSCNNEALYSIFFISESVGFSVGGNNGPALAVVYKTIDGGNKWKEVYKDTSEMQLYKVFFVNSSIGFACGSGGKLIKTTDSGETWEPIVISGVTNDLTSLFFSNEQTGWILSKTGVLKTTNSGKSWDNVLKIDSVDMYDMAFWGKDHGVVTGKSINNIYYTTDGTNWKKSTPPVLSGNYARSDIKCIYAINDSAIFAGGWGGLVLSQPTILIKSTDGGASWTHLAQSEQNRTWDNVYGMYFKDKNNGIALGGGARGSLGLRTTDGGVNWSQMSLPSGGSLRNTFGIGNTLWACNEDGFLIRSKDFGNSWELLMGIPNINLYAIQFASDKVAYAGGEDGVLMKSTDGGRSWAGKFIQIDKVSTKMNDLFFINENVGYTSHNYRRVCKTTDGGTSWKEVIKDTTSSFANSYGICFLNESLGFVVGCSSSKVDLIYKTTDGGNTWAVKSGTFQTTLRSVAFANESNGIVVGDGLKAGFTTDGGNTWTASKFNNVPSGSTSKRLKRVVFTSPTNAIAVGESIILTSTDGGANWNYVAVNGLTENLESLVFQNSIKGWAVGSRSPAKKNSVYLTVDGGKTWSDIADTTVIVSQTTLNDLTLDGNNMLWVCGSDGSIYTNSSIVSVQGKQTPVPASFELNQNYPNPFNPNTTIEYNLSTVSNVTLNVYDALGRCVMVLVKGEQNAGMHKVNLNASGLPSGLYFCSLNVNGKIQTKKMSLIK